ncbi:TPA: oligosaccharide flippase family protein [Vibrio harveyi]|nr:oligosaccharide flippase family protein [Vibrio harveyi]
MLQQLQQKRAATQNKEKSLFSLGFQTAVTRVLSAGFAFLLTLIVSRVTDASTSGQFFFLFNLAYFTAIISQLGFDVSLVKYNAIGFSNNNSEEQSNNYRIALARSLLFSVAACTFIYLAFNFFPKHVNTNGVSDAALALALLSIPLLVIGQTNSRVLQASRRVVPSLFALQLGVSFFMVALVLVAQRAYSIDADLLMILLVIATGAVALQSSIKWLKSDQYSHGKTEKNTKLTYSAKQVWFGSIFSNLVQWGSLVIAGFFLATSDLGLLAAAQRTSLLIGFVLVTINFVVAPMFASLYKEGKLDRLQSLSRLACRANIGAAMIPVVVCVAFPEFVMQLFGKEFTAAAPLLVALSLGQLVNVATGSVGFLLLMSGHEKTMKYITIVSGVISITLLVTLSQWYGVLGAAWAMAIGLAIQNLAALYFVKRYLGFFPVG